MTIMKSCNNLIDRQLIILRQVLTTGLFEKVERLFNLAADIVTPIAAVVGSLIAVVLAIKTDSLQIFLASFIWILALIICYYIGSKLQNACEKTLRNNPSSIANQEYLDVISVITLVGAMASFLLGIFFAVKFSYFQAFVIGLGIALLLIYSAWLTLQPSLVTTYVQESSSAGIDAIAILVLTSKIYLRSNKVLFGLLAVVGTILLVQALFNSFGEPYEILMGGAQGLLGFILVIVGLTAPFMCYVGFVLGYMLLDVMRSLLGIGKPNLPVQDFAPTNPGEPSGSSVSGPLVKKIILALIAVIVGLTVVIKGKELYNDYQIKAEARQAEEEKQKAEEEALKAAEAAEKSRVEAFVTNARKYVKKPAIDLVLDPQINGLFRQILGSDTSTFEGFFTQSNEVTEVDGLLLASGCRKDQCEQFKALAVVDLSGTKVFTVVIINGEPRFFGIQAADAPPAVKKWAMSSR